MSDLTEPAPKRLVVGIPQEQRSIMLIGDSARPSEDLLPLDSMWDKEIIQQYNELRRMLDSRTAMTNLQLAAKGATLEEIHKGWELHGNVYSPSQLDAAVAGPSATTGIVDPERIHEDLSVFGPEEYFSVEYLPYYKEGSETWKYHGMERDVHFTDDTSITEYPTSFWLTVNKETGEETIEFDLMWDQSLPPNIRYNKAFLSRQRGGAYQVTSSCGELDEWQQTAIRRSIYLSLRRASDQIGEIGKQYYGRVNSNVYEPVPGRSAMTKTAFQIDVEATKDRNPKDSAIYNAAIDRIENHEEQLWHVANPKPDSGTRTPFTF